MIVSQVPSKEYQTRIEAKGFLPAEYQREIGAGSGVDIDSNGNIFFLQRAGYGFSNTETIPKDVVVIYSPLTLKIVNSWGANIFKSPHGITIDDNDRVWISDVILNKIYQFDLDGNFLNTFGKEYQFYTDICLKVRSILKNLPCSMDKHLFARPTDIEVFPDGSFLVSDGYRNSRIAKFEADGDFLWEVSGIGNGDEDGEFYLPHGLATDESGNIYVADRRNARIQVFNRDGYWQETWDFPALGRPYGLDIGKDNFLYVVDAGDAYEFSNGEPRSQILKLTLKGEIVDNYSGFGASLGEMDLAHDIAIGDKGRIYVAEINNKRIQFFDQKPHLKSALTENRDEEADFRHAD